MITHSNAKPNFKCKFFLTVHNNRLSRVNKNPIKRSVSEETKAILRRNLTNEIEFYEFCKQRLYMQYAAISEEGYLENADYMMIPENTGDSLEDNEEY